MGDLLMLMPATNNDSNIQLAAPASQHSTANLEKLPLKTICWKKIRERRAIITPVLAGRRYS
jgi:hypothetical protein